MMSSLFNHLFIPVVILLIFSDKLGLDRKNIIALSFFAVLPDADALFQPHRAFFHNIFVLVIPYYAIVLAKDRRQVPGIIFFYLASHLVLDFFDGGIFLLYPVYNNVFFAHVELGFSNNSFASVLDYGISRSIMNSGKGEPVISSENIGIALILAVFLLISVIADKLKKKSRQ